MLGTPQQQTRTGCAGEWWQGCQQHCGGSWPWGSSSSLLPSLPTASQSLPERGGGEEDAGVQRRSFRLIILHMPCSSSALLNCRFT